MPPHQPKRLQANSPSHQIPMEIVEIIIDNVPDGATFLSCSLVCKEWVARCRYYLFSRITTAAGSCGGELLFILEPLASNNTIRLCGFTGAHSPLSPAGKFVQSLVIMPTAPSILYTSSIHASNVERLVKAIPNVRELHLEGTTEWEMVHFFDPLVRSRRLADVSLLHIQIESTEEIMSRILLCSSTLRSLRLGGFRFQPSTPLMLECDKTNTIRNGIYEAEMSSSDPQSFEFLERLTLEPESGGYPFVDQTLNRLMNSSSMAFEHLSRLEMPLKVPERVAALFKRVGGTLTHLTFDCRERSGASASFVLDLNSLRVLKELTLLSASDLGSHLPRALLHALEKYPHNTIEILRIIRSYPSFSSSSVTAWRQVDSFLALRHLKHLHQVELGGLFTVAQGVKRDIFPLAWERGILVFLT